MLMKKEHKQTIEKRIQRSPKATIQSSILMQFWLAYPLGQSQIPSTPGKTWPNGAHATWSARQGHAARWTSFHSHAVARATGRREEEKAMSDEEYFHAPAPPPGKPQTTGTSMTNTQKDSIQHSYQNKGHRTQRCMWIKFLHLCMNNSRPKTWKFYTHVPLTVQDYSILFTHIVGSHCD